MNIEIFDGVAGAEDLRGCVLVLDVIRASNTIIAALTAGAEAVHLVSELDQARALKEANPSWLLWGERGGVQVPGFEGDNSPANALAQDLEGQTVVLSTSNGTRAPARLAQAGPVFIASLGNAAALFRVLQELRPEMVHLLAVGSEHEYGAPEDRLVAEHLRAMLRGEEPDPRETRTRILGLATAHELHLLTQEQDLEVCSQPDYSTVVPVLSFDGHPAAKAWRS